MRIVSWNCNGKFRDKFPYITALDADIYIIQECENPTKFPTHTYMSFASNYIWTGERDSKGLGVFAKPHIHLSLNNWEKYCLRNFISFKVNGKFDIVAVWACKPYIEEYFIYQSINLSKYNNRTIIIGDFNSNAIWDKKHDTRTHSAVTKQLEAIGLCSAYHHKHQEEQGAESIPTFYLYRHPNKPYHIDHCFTAPLNIQAYNISSASHWLTHSDHLPIILDYFD